MDISNQDLSDVQRDFLAYWRRKAGDAAAPRWQDFDVLDVPILMPHAIVLDVIADPLDFRHRLVGTLQRDMSTRDYTGMMMSEIDGRGPGSRTWSILDEVRTSRAPAYHSITYVGPETGFRKLTALFLPWLGDDGETNTIIIVSRYLPK